ncbi:hypothetical protein VKT23_012403 [Stygiomarasmius scandens]|uniref:DUF6593 domain-containing protein n=1 Tax=Marasmiellus scandens TaxID=2682957 RepID=A0ABR1JAM6_9AGAR
MKEFTFSSAKHLFLSSDDLLNTDIIDSRSGQPVYSLHTPEKSGINLKGVNKVALESFIICIDKLDLNDIRHDHDGGNLNTAPGIGRELVATIEKHALHADVIRMHGSDGVREIKPLEWVEKKSKLEFTNPGDGKVYQWICKGPDFQLVEKSNPSTEIAIFKQGKQIPPTEGQDNSDSGQQWTGPILSVNIDELSDLAVSTFAYYAKIKIDNMGRGGLQPTEVYSAGIVDTNHDRVHV